jgi:hypothetical protein
MPAARPVLDPPAQLRLGIAQRVADAHRGIDDNSLLSFVSGSTVENLCDDLSDIDMSVVFDRRPDEAVLRSACRSVGEDWFWWQHDESDGSLVVSFRVERIEVQIGYASHASLGADMDRLLVRHEPDTPYHKLAEGILKAVPLAGPERFAALHARVAAFPPELGRAMVRHGLVGSPSWRGIALLQHRDAALWCREIQVDGCYRILLMLAGLNGRYFTRFQVKRTHRLARSLAIAPPLLAERIDALLAAPVNEGLAALHALEGEVVDLVEQHLPEIDLALARTRRAAWPPV